MQLRQQLLSGPTRRSLNYCGGSRAFPQSLYVTASIGAPPRVPTSAETRKIVETAACLVPFHRIYGISGRLWPLHSASDWRRHKSRINLGLQRKPSKWLSTELHGTRGSLISFYICTIVVAMGCRRDVQEVAQAQARLVLGSFDRGTSALGLRRLRAL